MRSDFQYGSLKQMYIYVHIFTLNILITKNVWKYC